MKKQPFRRVAVVCPNCRQRGEECRAIHQKDAANLFTAVTDLADCQTALDTTRHAVIDLWDFFERVSESRSEWTAADTVRLKEIEHLVHVQRNLVQRNLASVKISPQRPIGQKDGSNEHPTPAIPAAVSVEPAAPAQVHTRIVTKRTVKAVE